MKKLWMILVGIIFFALGYFVCILVNFEPFVFNDINAAWHEQYCKGHTWEVWGIDKIPTNKTQTIKIETFEGGEVNSLSSLEFKFDNWQLIRKIKRGDLLSKEPNSFKIYLLRNDDTLGIINPNFKVREDIYVPAL